MFTLGGVAVFLAVGALIQVVTIWGAARVTRVKHVTAQRALAVLGLQLLLYATMGLLACTIFFIPTSLIADGPRLLLLWTYLLISSFTWLVAARYILESHWWQAVVIYIAQSAVAAACLVAMKLLVLEAFIVPTNPMAPTILGHHFVGRCPECGGNVIVTASRDAYGEPEPIQQGICDECWSSQLVEVDYRMRHSGDRIVSSKLEQPRRFDVVVYVLPEPPFPKLVHRLVGLPGERVTIRNGRLWIDGREVLPPPSLNKLRYTLDPMIIERFGNQEASWQLGPDEYFVHGDNTDLSMDSRYTGPIKEESLQGVVVGIYWPPTRIRLLGLMEAP